MPIPAPYVPFSKACIDAGVGYEQWQKTAETDKIINLLYDQIDGRNSSATKVNRGQALINYLAVKTLMTVPAYADAGAEVRLLTNELTYNNTLVAQGDGQFGLCGRFHRVFTTVLNEMTYTGTPATQAEITQVWIQNLVDGVYAGLGLFLPPTVSPITAYSIDGADAVLNDGSTIDLTEGQSISMTSVAVGATSSDWEKDTVSIGGETDNTLTIASVVVADTGVYRNAFTNGSGTVYGDDFDVSVTL